MVGTDFKSSELEIGVAHVDKPFFTKLRTEQIEEHLNAIADAN